MGYALDRGARAIWLQTAVVVANTGLSESGDWGACVGCCRCACARRGRQRAAPLPPAARCCLPPSACHTSGSPPTPSAPVFGVCYASWNSEVGAWLVTPLAFFTGGGTSLTGVGLPCTRLYPPLERISGYSFG